MQSRGRAIFQGCVNLFVVLGSFSQLINFQLTEGGQGNTKEDAAQGLSDLSRGAAPFGAQHLPVHYPQQGGLPGVNDPGPSSHPRGPPNLGQLSALAVQASPVSVQQSGQSHHDDGGDQSGSASTSKDGAGSPGQSSTPPVAHSRRGGRNPAIGTEEWTRQRKDNHVRNLNLLRKR